MTPEVERARSNVWAHAYNAAVNYGTERGHRKMRELIEALNLCMRIEGTAKLQALVEQGVIENFKPCSPECQMRPGGLFHAKDCENDSNHEVSRARRQAAREKLPGGSDGFEGVRAADVSLVGEPGLTTLSYYHGQTMAGILRGVRGV